ncbi:MAG TPA: hypothetical protein VNA23_03755 [Anaerolineales bacterium]|nr:hypothetical protein [Anaerolineales bacterium]
MEKLYTLIRQFIADLLIPLSTVGIAWQIVTIGSDQIFGLPRPDAVAVFLTARCGLLANQAEAR